MKRDYAGLALVLIVFAVGLAWLMAQPLDVIGRVAREGGAVETASAIGFAACALLVWTRSGTAVSNKVCVTVILLAMAARELDMDKRFFTRGLFKSSQYLKEGVPLAEKIVGGAIILCILGCLIGLFLRERRTLWAGLRGGYAGALAVALAVAFAGIAKSLDGIARKLEPFGVRVTDALSVRFQGIEEVMELTIMALLLVAILAVWPGVDRAGDRGGDRG